MFRSCKMDAVDFPGLRSFSFLVAAAQNETEVYGNDPDMQDSMQHGTIITNLEQRQQFRDAIQELRKHYKSEVQKWAGRGVSHVTHSITKIFVPTIFPEDGNDGEQWDGVNLTITYDWSQTLEWICVDVENGYVLQNPNLNGRS